MARLQDNEVIIKESSADFRVNRFDVKKGEIEAVVTSFKNYDVVNDKINAGALDDFIKNFEGGLQMLYSHDQKEIIGEWNSFEIKGDLVIGKGEIYPEVSRGADTIALMSRGQIGATSIGFKASEYNQNEKGGYDFDKIELVEVSMVKRPANPKAQVISAKNDDGSINVKELEKLLRDAGLSRKESKTVISGGMPELRDAIKAELDNKDFLVQLEMAIRGK